MIRIVWGDALVGVFDGQNIVWSSMFGDNVEFLRGLAVLIFNQAVKSLPDQTIDENQKINPLGIKGVGEIGIVGTAAAIANAIYHATGKRVRDLPITIDKLLRD